MLCCLALYCIVLYLSSVAFFGIRMFSFFRHVVLCCVELVSFVCFVLVLCPIVSSLSSVVVLNFVQG